MCGGNGLRFRRIRRAGGLSPRVRGKPPGMMQFDVAQGSIPACAGETGQPSSGARRIAVYPRVCGGNPVQRWGERHQNGLSPRVQGKRNGGFDGLQVQRSIPACAGETLSMTIIGSFASVYPRVCGGNQPWRWKSWIKSGLSPRVRGKRSGENPEIRAGRSIPACAGETAAVPGLSPVPPVYPRVCGGNGNNLMCGNCFQGLSPRVRGKHCTKTQDCQPPKVYPRVCGGNVVRYP